MIDTAWIVLNETFSDKRQAIAIVMIGCMSLAFTWGLVYRYMKKYGSY